MPAIEEQKAMPSEELESPVEQAPEDSNGKKPAFFVSKRTRELGENNSKSLIVAASVGVALIVGIFMLSHAEKPGAKSAPATVQVSAAKPPEKNGSGYVPGDQSRAGVEEKDAPATSASDVENTKNFTGDVQSKTRTSEVGSVDHERSATRSSGSPTKQNLGSVPPFQPPVYQPGAGTYAVPSNPGSSNGPAGKLQEETALPSMIFVAQASSTPATSAAGASASEPITNFGLEPGFHISAHLEASVSTVGGVPAVAVIEYDYMRDGKVVIPAGSRVIGKIAGASSTGLVNLSFSEIYFPNSARVPVSAMGLDLYLHQIKGIVTGRNTLKQIALASITSAGSLGAGFFGNNNSGAITQADLARMQIASNIGNAGDQAIQQMQVSQSLVVTVPSGTPLYVTFVAPLRGALVGAAEQQTSRTQSK